MAGRALIRRRQILIGLCALPLLLLLFMPPVRTIFFGPHLEGFDRGCPWATSTASWKAYGGAWELANGVMRDNSYERGAKLITGSPWAGDYKIEADLAMIGNYGGAGLILRVQDPDEGVDSYSGFSVGIRTLDNAMTVGRADYGWDEYQRIAIPGGAELNHFYHLTAIAVGCDIAARLDLPDGPPLRVGVSLQSCNRRGQYGLKSYQTPAAWRNLHVTPASMSDLRQLMSGKPLASAVAGNLHYYDPRVDERTPIEREALSREVDVKTTPIAQLQLASSPTSLQHAAVHGVVRLIKPLTYVEDPTGSIVVASHDQPALAIGDEVVIAGEVGREDGELQIRNGNVQILWSQEPASPQLVSPDQIATGSWNGRLVQVNGELLGEDKGPGGSKLLELTGGGETFRVIASPSPLGQPISLRPGSELQLIGVVRSDRTYAGNRAFAILLSPMQGALQVIREAPWWTLGRMAAAALILLTLITMVAFLYHRFRQQYLIRLMAERELLAHDLHDTVSQSLAGIGFQLDSAASSMDEAPARVKIEQARVMVRQSHEELRRSVTTLRNQIAAVTDLARALDKTAHKLTAGSSISVKCNVNGVRRHLPVSVADCFFRIGQEALTNAVHHAKASRVEILLQHEGKMLSLHIRDDGNGFTPNEHESGHGLFGMRKRAEMIGADFAILRNEHGITIVLEKQISYSFRFFDSVRDLFGSWR